MLFSMSPQTLFDHSVLALILIDDLYHCSHIFFSQIYESQTGLEPLELHIYIHSVS